MRARPVLAALVLAGSPKLFNNEESDGALTHRAGLSLSRLTGGNQLFECPAFPVLKPRSGNTEISAMPIKGSGLVVPLRITDTKLLKLKAGRSLSDRVRIGGACDTFLVNPETTRATAAYTNRCTVKASIVIVVKRTVH